MGRTLCIALFASLIFAAAAAAQAPLDDFSRLPERVKPGTEVIVIDEKGQGTKGKITDLSPASLQIMTSGMREHLASYSGSAGPATAKTNRPIVPAPPCTSEPRSD